MFREKEKYCKIGTNSDVFEKMIVFNNISLKRGQTELLENATATINPKQKVGLVGKNGCGKSSLFALLKKELTP